VPLNVVLVLVFCFILRILLTLFELGILEYGGSTKLILSVILLILLES
jgi:hypothetical protein